MAEGGALEGDSLDGALRAAVQYAVCQICNGRRRSNGDGTTTTAMDDSSDGDGEMTTTTNCQMTPEALASLSELTFHYALSCLSADVDAFSTHAGRRTIAASDVLLAVRKHAQVSQHVKDKLQLLNANGAGIATSTKRASLSTTGRNRDSATAKPKRSNSAKTSRHSINRRSAATALDDSTDSDSSSDVEMIDVANVKRGKADKKMAASKSHTTAHGGSKATAGTKLWKPHYSSSSSSSDDEVLRRFAKKTKSVVNESSKTSGNGASNKPQAQPPLSRSSLNDEANPPRLPRFRLPNAKDQDESVQRQGNDKGNNDGDDDSSCLFTDDDAAAAAATASHHLPARDSQPSQKAKTVKATQSRVEAIVANLSLDSAPSEDDLF